MGKRKSMFDLEELVTGILMECPRARDNDDYLFMLVCKKINPCILDNDLRYVLMNFKNFGVPRYESVGRARRKAQERYPELSANPAVENMRDEQETEFRAYARS